MGSIIKRGRSSSGFGKLTYLEANYSAPPVGDFIDLPETGGVCRIGFKEVDGEFVPLTDEESLKSFDEFMATPEMQESSRRFKIWLDYLEYEFLG